MDCFFAPSSEEVEEVTENKLVSKKEAKTNRKES